MPDLPITNFPHKPDYSTIRKVSRAARESLVLRNAVAVHQKIDPSQGHRRDYFRGLKKDWFIPQGMENPWLRILQKKLNLQRFNWLNEKFGLNIKALEKPRNPLNFSGKNLTGANLKGAKLPGINLSNTNLYRANLAATDLSEANLSEAGLYGAHLAGANLSKADLSFANLLEANLQKANLSNAELYNTNLAKANLTQANLNEAKLYGAHLAGANLTQANLNKAMLSGANLAEANFTQANLNKAWLPGTNLVEANFTQANLRGSKFGDGLPDVTPMYNAQFYGALVNRQTTLKNRYVMDLMGWDQARYSRNVKSKRPPFANTIFHRKATGPKQAKWAPMPEKPFRISLGRPTNPVALPGVSGAILQYGGYAESPEGKLPPFRKRGKRI